MDTAKVSEIFMSYQGEGSFVGSRQLFIRFYGCNRTCSYCDTQVESYKSFTKDALLGRVIEFDDNYNELVLTGGEPLLHADFLSKFLSIFKRHIKKPVYLESNGTLPDELKKIIQYIDIVAMDIKLPSSAGSDEGDWALHEEFIIGCEGKELVVKSVVTDTTTMDDITLMAELVRSTDPGTDIILQPVSPVNDLMKGPDSEMMGYFQKYLEKNTSKKVIIFGQAHKVLGIR